jgi:hypothetical protein
METNRLTIAASETVKLKDSTRCLLDRHADGYKRQIQTEADQINADKTRGIYFSRSRRPPESHLTLNGRDIPFVYIIKYLGVIFDKKGTWRLHIEMIEAKASRTFIRIYSLFNSER